MRRTTIAALTFALSTLAIAGCRHGFCHKRGCDNGPPPPPPPGVGGPAPRPFYNLPPQGIQPDPGVRSGSFSPELLVPEQPKPNRPSLGEPELLEPTAPKPRVGGNSDPQGDKMPKGPEELKKLEPEKPTAPLPEGINDFDKVATQDANQIYHGRRPELKGLDWLKNQNFAAVLFLRAPDEDDTTDRKEVEKRGMVYHSLIVTPDSIVGPDDIVKKFADLVQDKKIQKLFVYDNNSSGNATGAMWYLYFRKVKSKSSEQAQVIAKDYGFDKPGPLGVQFKTAVNQYLSKNP